MDSLENNKVEDKKIETPNSKVRVIHWYDQFRPGTNIIIGSTEDEKYCKCTFDSGRLDGNSKAWLDSCGN